MTSENTIEMEEKVVKYYTSYRDEFESYCYVDNSSLNDKTIAFLKPEMHAAIMEKINAKIAVNKAAKEKAEEEKRKQQEAEKIAKNAAMTATIKAIKDNDTEMTGIDFEADVGWNTKIYLKKNGVCLGVDIYKDCDSDVWVVKKNYNKVASSKFLKTAMQKAVGAAKARMAANKAVDEFKAKQLAKVEEIKAMGLESKIDTRYSQRYGTTEYISVSKTLTKKDSNYSTTKVTGAVGVDGVVDGLQIVGCMSVATFKKIADMIEQEKDVIKYYGSEVVV